jgi:AmiR/NasT family two-component response regulator
LSSDVQNIIELLGPREVIGRAIIVLMARNDMSRDDAFATLVRDSSLSRQTVREVAAAIVAQQGD